MNTAEIDVGATVAALKALANPARLRIALHLINGEKGVSEIEGDLGLRQPNLSQYLAELREAGLVTTRREARHIFYSLADARIERVLLALVSDPVKSMKIAAEATTHARSSRPGAAASFATVAAWR